MTRYTDDKLFEKGIWNCLECGQLNTLEEHMCGKCLQDKFIMRERNAPKWRHSKEYKAEPAKPVKNATDYTKSRIRVYDKRHMRFYESIKEASIATDIPYKSLFAASASRVKNQYPFLIFVIQK